MNAPWMRWLSPMLFVGGFLVDVLTLRGELKLLPLLVLTSYATVLVVALGLRARDVWPKAGFWLDVAAQFALGSLFSAMVVLYFKSAAHVWALGLVMALFVVMVWNEFWGRRESQRGLQWGLAAVSLVMLLNVLLPHAVRSINTVWFYVSLVAGSALVLGLYWLTRPPRRFLAYVGGLTGMLALLYALDAIPPVPLVRKASVVGVGLDKSAGRYATAVEPQETWVRLGLGAPLVRYRTGEPVYVLTSVAAPSWAVARMEHRWFREKDGAWEPAATVGVNIRGGRKAGWRFYSMKQNVGPGRWKVETALADGAVLARDTFVLELVDAKAPVARQRAVLP